MSRVLALLLLLVPAILIALAPAAPAADPPKLDAFLTVQKGTLPIILSVPHGGRKKVPGVPLRAGSGIANFQTVRDENTAELADKLVAELEKSFEAKPWVVIARFERKYLDVNRPPEQAYESDKAKPYYDAYHAALDTACKAVKKKFGRGLLLDIHGQAAYPDAICRGTQNFKTVTLLKNRDGLAAIRGKNSVLGRMEKYGYGVLPRGDADVKVKEVAKFNGGYIVATYGSHTAYAIDAIQVELGSTYRSKEKYAKTADDLADAIRVFYDEYLADTKK